MGATSPHEVSELRTYNLLLANDAQVRQKHRDVIQSNFLLNRIHLNRFELLLELCYGSEAQRDVQHPADKRKSNIFITTLLLQYE